MYEDVDSIPEYINVLKDARNRLARAAMTITDEQVMAISSPSVLASDDYHTECKQWNKLLTYQCTWFAWKTTFCDASAVRIRADGIRGESDQPFDGFSGVAAQQQTPSVSFNPLPTTTLLCDAQMDNTTAGYMDNLAKAVGVDSRTFTTVNERLAEIIATLESLAESYASFAATISEQSKQLRSLRKLLNKTKKSGGGGGSPSDSRVASWARDKYCHTHGYGVRKNYTSSTCFLPGDNHKRSTKRANTMDSSVLNKGWDDG